MCCFLFQLATTELFLYHLYTALVNYEQLSLINAVLRYQRISYAIYFSLNISVGGLLTQ